MRWLLLLVLVSSGCAHQTIRQQNYLKRMAAWKGQPIEGVIESWGPPDRVFESPSGKSMYTWVESGGVSYSSGGFGGARFGRAHENVCKTVFTVGESGVVERVMLDGACGPIPD